MSKTVVVTGSSSGFGLEAAERMARRGDRVYATMRGVQGKNSEVAAQLSGTRSRVSSLKTRW